MKSISRKPIKNLKYQAQQSNHPVILSIFLATVFYMFMLNAPLAQAEENTSTIPTQVEKKLDATEIEQTQLIKQALKYDFFGQRCRGSSLTKHFNQTNRLFLSKYGFTANNYIKDYINPEIDEFKAELKQEFLKSLIKIGDCRGARELNWRKQMNDDFNRLYDDVEKSIWFPE